eukprot:TRINITY_DN3904_c0_g2_i1.p1 TRINITY_DN3904_c0_g2~~TRINITY_DN3904_c0_g2_i1.p1  ORF type:complete len:109 (-),score=21.64 TRINITY_DN3904_c0_g2_i1:3-329(-)
MDWSFRKIAMQICKEENLPVTIKLSKKIVQIFQDSLKKSLKEYGRANFPPLGTLRIAYKKSSYCHDIANRKLVQQSNKQKRISFRYSKTHLDLTQFTPKKTNNKNPKH